MAETKHTPGPWFWDQTHDRWTVHRGPNSTPIACGTDGDARLIAAAPDALEFAQFYDTYMSEQFPDGLQKNYDNRTLHPKAAETWGRCKNFIAKATGAKL